MGDVRQKEPPMPPAAEPYLEAFDRWLGAETMAERWRARDDMTEVLPWLIAESDEAARTLRRDRGRGDTNGRAGPQ